MQRSTILKLREAVWVECADLELCLIPSAATELVESYFGLGRRELLSQREKEQVCRHLFVDFRGYMDGDKPVPNSMQARLELVDAAHIMATIKVNAMRLHSEAISGEPVAASD